MTREFILKPAVREKVPLFVGLVGPSGSGKTYSALRLAKGMARVSDGPIVFIDTENRRALHYASEFDFQHVAFGAPFGSLDYLAALQAVSKCNPSVIVIDSMSHEHEGPGGLLDAQEKELDRMAGDNYGKRMAMTFPAFAKPKSHRRALLHGLTRLNTNVIACFRAKEKTKMLKGSNGKNVPTDVGWSAITEETFVYEMALCALLMPGANGVPTWNPSMDGERAFVKQPGWSRGLFSPGQALDESHGEALATWAAGGAAPGEVDSLDVGALESEGGHAASLGMSFLKVFWGRLSAREKAALNEIKENEWKPVAIKADAKIEDSEFEETENAD